MDRTHLKKKKKKKKNRFDEKEIATFYETPEVVCIFV